MAFVRLRRGAVLAAAVLLLSTVVVGCSSSADANGGVTFTYGRPASVTSFDLHKEITSNNAFAIDKVFEPLVAFDSNGKIVDWLAASHTVSADGLTYTFVLRDGLQFSNGTPVTAADAVFSLNRHLKVGGPLEISAQVKSVTAADPKTVVIVLEKAYTPFLSQLSNFANGVLPQDFGGVTEEEFFKKPVGTGPFVVESWDPAGDLVFAKNPHYWQAGKPTIAKLVYKLVQDDSQAINQLKAGEVNAIESVALENAADLNQGTTKVVSNGSWVTEQLFFNTLDPHFSDVHARRALALALDREGLTKAVTFGFGEVAHSLLPPALPYSTNATIRALNFDVEAAKKELALSKFPQGFSTKLLIASGNSARTQEAQIIQAAAKSIGIDLQIETVELAAFRDRFFKYDFSAMLNSGQADSPEADSVLAFQTDPEGFSKSYWTHYANPKVTDLLHRGQTTLDGPDRAAIYADLQQILADEVPYVPLYYPSIVKAVGASVEGLVVLPNDSVRFQDVVLKAK